MCTISVLIHIADGNLRETFLSTAAAWVWMYYFKAFWARVQIVLFPISADFRQWELIVWLRKPLSTVRSTTYPSHYFAVSFFSLCSDAWAADKAVPPYRNLRADHRAVIIFGYWEKHFETGIGLRSLDFEWPSISKDLFLFKSLQKQEFARKVFPQNIN